MPSSGHALITDPVSWIRTKYAQSMEQQQQQQQQQHSHEDFFRESLERELKQHPEMLKDIPYISVKNLDNLKPNSLVRFRGMVQDMFDPEFYVQSYKIDGHEEVVCGMYQERLHVPDGGEAKPIATAGRQPVYLISVPGESQWVSPVVQPDTGAAAASSEAPPASTPFQSGGATKRARDDDEMEGGDATMDDVVASEDKKQRAGGEGSSGMTEQQSVDQRRRALNFPLPDTEGIGCVATIYTANGDAPVKICDIVECIGILNIDHDLVEQEVDPAFANPASTLSRSIIHHVGAITFRSIPDHNPALIVESNGKQQLSEAIPTIRSQIIEVLKHILGGDELAAEYTLLHLMSRIHTRHGATVVGPLSLNLSGFEDHSTRVKELHSFISDVMPRAVNIPLSISFLNNNTFMPRKDYDQNRVLAGVLQLVDGTCVVVDETSLEPGQLLAPGVSNVQCLKQVMASYTLEYDFKYHSSQFPVDLKFLVCSTGKSMFPTLVQVPLTLAGAPQSSVSLSPEFVAACRQYFATMSREKFDMSEDVSKRCEADYIAARQTDSKSTDAEVFHRWLVLSRLSSLSHGCNALSVERWQGVLAMEHALKQRSSPATS